jgi:hypothetical protein
LIVAGSHQGADLGEQIPPEIVRSLLVRITAVLAAPVAMGVILALLLTIPLLAVVQLLVTIGLGVWLLGTNLTFARRATNQGMVRAEVWSVPTDDELKALASRVLPFAWGTSWYLLLFRERSGSETAIGAIGIPSGRGLAGKTLRYDAYGELAVGGHVTLVGEHGTVWRGAIVDLPAGALAVTDSESE